MAQALTRSEVRWNEKTIGALIILALLPNLLGTINLATPWGFQIHVFQAAIFLAALIFGRWAGLIAGAAGSIYVAAALSNPPGTLPRGDSGPLPRCCSLLRSRFPGWP